MTERGRGHKKNNTNTQCKPLTELTHHELITRIKYHRKMLKILLELESKFRI